MDRGVVVDGDPPDLVGLRVAALMTVFASRRKGAISK
jgi:hypothetical protein